MIRTGFTVAQFINKYHKKDSELFNMIKNIYREINCDLKDKTQLYFPKIRPTDFGILFIEVLESTLDSNGWKTRRLNDLNDNLTIIKEKCYLKTKNLEIIKNLANRVSSDSKLTPIDFELLIIFEAVRRAGFNNYILEALIKKTSIDYKTSEKFLVDLEEIKKIIYKRKKISKSNLIFNPTFGVSIGDDILKLIVPGDGDLIVNGVLFEVKCSKYLKFKPDYFYQLVIYLILNEIRKERNLEHNITNNKVGYWNPLYDIFTTFDLTFNKELVDVFKSEYMEFYIKTNNL